MRPRATSGPTCTATDGLGLSTPRHRTSLYPLWLGLLALGAGIALWFAAADAGSTAQPAATDAGPPDAASATAPPTPPPDTALVWRVEGRGPIEADALALCLTAAGYDRALVIGDAALIITHPGRTRPLRVEPVAADLEAAPRGLAVTPAALEVTTAIDGDARLAASLHVAITACLYAPEATVFDPLLDRRLRAESWPQLGERGGASIESLVRVDPVEGGLATRGLARLGRPELAVAISGAADSDARRLLVEAAAAAVAAELPIERLELSSGPVRLVAPSAARAAGWWRGNDAGLRVLADAATDGLRPARARPAPAARADLRGSPAADRTAATPSAPKPATPATRPTPRPTPPIPGGFRPEYR